MHFKVAAIDPDGTTYIEIERTGGSGKIVLGGDTDILGNLVTPGSITAREIEANGITRTFSAKNSGPVALSPEMADIVTFDVVMARAGSIMVHGVHQLVFSTGAWATEVRCDGSVLMSGSGNVDHQSVLIGEFAANAPGTYAVRLRAMRTSGAVSINAGGSVLLIHRTYA